MSMRTRKTTKTRANGVLLPANTLNPVAIGRTTSVWQTRVTDAEGQRIAIVTQTQMALPGRSGPQQD